jgi:transcriptional regulator with XRE-family HTH domain
LTQDEVARHLGLTRAGYGHYEREDQPFTVDQLFQLSRILGKPITWFLGIDTGLREDQEELLAIYDSIPDQEERDQARDLLRTFARPWLSKAKQSS